MNNEYGLIWELSCRDIENISVLKCGYQRNGTIILELTGCLIHVLYASNNFRIL